MRILIIKLSAIGDVVQSLAVLNSIKHSFPDAHVSWVVAEAAYPILADHPMLEDVFLFPRRRWGAMSSNLFAWPKLLSEVLSFSSLLRQKEYDIVLDMQGLLRSGLLCMVTRSGRKIGFDGSREMSSHFLNEKLPPYNPDEHAVSRYMKIASYLGADTSNIEFPLPIRDGDRAQVMKWLDAAGIAPDRAIAFNVGASWTTKQWPPEAFSRLVKDCYEKLGLFPVLTGGPGDVNIASRIESNIHDVPVLNLVAKTSLLELAALFEALPVVVTSDSGPMHIAMASGTRVVAIFGPTAPWRTGPFGAGHEVVRLDIKCSPCFKRECQHINCMTDISPDMVFKRVEKIMEG